MPQRKRSDADFQAEIQAHLQLEIDRLRAQGLSEEQAASTARRSFGNITAAEERFHESRRWTGWDRLARNIRFGGRMLARNPGSSLVAILALALAIGANAAIFSLLNAVILRPLPVPQPDRLALFGRGRWRGSVDELPYRSWQLFSYNTFREFRSKSAVFSDVAAISSILFTTHGRVGGGADLEKVAAELVSGSYFHTLDVNPVAGRVLTAADDVTPGGHPVAVASYSWWSRRLGSNPSAVGSTVTVGATTYTIIGVAPPGFSGVEVGQSPDVWIPLAMQKEISPGWNGLENNLFQSLYLVARLKPGTSMEQASANVNVLFQQIIHGLAGPRPTPKQIEAMSHARVDLTSASTGLSQLRAQFSSPLLILMATVGVVLLIACANVANLLLARAAGREREIAVRMSIGAGRAQLIQQLLTENALLGIIGAVLGVALGWFCTRFLLLAISGSSDPVPVSVAPDVRVLGFLLALTLLTVLLFGTAPAFRASRVDLASSLKLGGSHGASARQHLSRALIVAQVALSLGLLAGAGLFLHSLVNLMNVDPGFDQNNVLLTGINPSAAGYKVDPRLENMMQRVEERVSAIPGVQAAAFAFFVFNMGSWSGPVNVPGRPVADEDPEVQHNIVGVQYLKVMKTPIILGRDLSSRDTANSTKVAVINEAMAAGYFPGVSPVGRTFSVRDNAGFQNVEVVGVVKDAKYLDLTEKPRPAAFYPHSQRPGIRYNFVVRYSGQAQSLTPQIRRAVHEVDANLPVGDFQTLRGLVRESVSAQRLVAALCSVFAALAALLACIGIYGVMSYSIVRRTNEIGIRMALGATRGDIVWSVLRDASSLVLIGVLAGGALALGGGRLVRNLMFGLQPGDPLTLCAAVLLIVAAALGSAWLPARRATRIDPIKAVRAD